MKSFFGEPGGTCLWRRPLVVVVRGYEKLFSVGDCVVSGDGTAPRARANYKEYLFFDFYEPCFLITLL